MDSFIEILNQAKTGDTDAYNALVLRFQDMAVGYAYGILGDLHHAEDAAQEAFISAYADLCQLRAPEAFPAWFRKVVFKQCDRLTRRKQIPTVPLEKAEAIISNESGPEEMFASEEIKKLVHGAIERLPAPERAVTELFYIKNYSHQEVAETLAISVATVKNRLRSSRKLLKERMYGMTNATLAEEQITPSITQMAPLLTVFDVKRSIAFYRDVLGFEVEGTFEWRGGFGFASLKRGDIKLMLNAAAPPDESNPEEDKPRSKDVTFYLWAVRVENLREKFLEEGHDVGDLHETYYGMKQFALFDPDGYKLVLQEPNQGASSPSAKPGTA